MYLKIAFLAIARLLLHIRRRYPPRHAANNTPNPSSKFLFFIFFIFSIGVPPPCVSVIVVHPSSLSWSVEAQPTD